MEQKISIEEITLQEIVTKLGIKMDSKDFMVDKYIVDAGKKLIKSWSEEEIQKKRKDFEQMLKQHFFVIPFSNEDTITREKDLKPYVKALMARFFYVFVAEKHFGLTKEDTKEEIYLKIEKETGCNQLNEMKTDEKKEKNKHRR